MSQHSLVRTKIMVGNYVLFEGIIHRIISISSCKFDEDYIKYTIYDTVRTDISGQERIFRCRLQPIPVTKQNIVELLQAKENIVFGIKQTMYTIGGLDFITEEDISLPDNNNLISLTFCTMEQADAGEIIISRIKECKYIHEVQNIINTCS